jgi:hypothetical protein
MTGYAAILVSFFTGVFLSIRYFGDLLDFFTGRVKGRGVRNGPWKTHLGVGRKRTSKIEKAAIARIGLGANDSDETIYWNAFVDDEGNNLWSGHDYQIVFIGKPPVRYDEKGFWSITVYGEDKFLVPNPYHRYMLRSDVKSEFDYDYRFSILLSGNKPENTALWIPLPQRHERFTIALRCYVPDREMITDAEGVKLPSILKC